MIPKKKRKRIYVIDSDRDIVDAIKLILETKGFTVSYPPDDDWQNIVTHVAGFDPDAILLDPITASGLAGDLDTIQKLKHSPETAHIPILMLSSRQAHEFLASEQVPQPIDGVVFRPLTSATLLEQIRRFAA